MRTDQGVRRQHLWDPARRRGTKSLPILPGSLVQGTESRFPIRRWGGIQKRTVLASVPDGRNSRFESVRRAYSMEGTREWAISGIPVYLSLTPPRGTTPTPLLPRVDLTSP